MITADRSILYINGIKGKESQETVYISNASDKEIQIKTWSSCGCTLPTLRVDGLKPGETDMITVKYKPTTTGLDEKEFGVKFKLRGQTYKLVITIIAKNTGE